METTFVTFARIQSSRGLSAACRTWTWEVAQPLRCTAPFPLQPKETATRPRARAPSLARRGKEAKVTKLEPMKGEPILSKCCRVLRRSSAWAACRHGETNRCLLKLEAQSGFHFLVNRVSFLSLTDWTESNMKMEKSTSPTRKLATNPDSASENGV